MMICRRRMAFTLIGKDTVPGIERRRRRVETVLTTLPEGYVIEVRFPSRRTCNSVYVRRPG